MRGLVLPAAVTFVLRNAAIGAGIGLALAALLVATDAGGLRSLISETRDPWAPLFLLGLGFATLMSGLYTAAAIMLLGRGESSEGEH